MKTVKLFIMIHLLCTSMLCAKVPDWSVNPSEFSNSMVFVGAISVDRKESMHVKDQIAAFIDGEVRGVATLKYEASIDRYLAYLLIYNSVTSSDITFKIYDASDDKQMDVPNTSTFVADGLKGDPILPFIWSNVELNSDALFERFSITDSFESIQIDDDEISISVESGTDLSQVVSTFTLSSGAKVWVDRVEQVSGESITDFSQPVSYTVVAEDGQSSKDYTIIVNVITGIEDDWEGFSIFPNPTFGELNFKTSNSSIVDLSKMRILDLSGKNYTAFITIHNNKLDVGELRQGVYLLELIDNQSIKHIRFIKN